MSNNHIGSDFNDFLKEDGIYEETNDIAIKRVIAYQLDQEMKAQMPITVYPDTSVGLNRTVE